MSARRRSRFAGVVVMLLGLTVTGGAAALVAGSAGASDDLSDDAALVAEGRQLFLVGCSSCHGKNAEGIPTKSGNQYGPSLVGVGAASVDFQVGTGRMPMANPTSQAPRKAPVYSEEETRALSAYIASLGPGPAIPDERYTDVSDRTQEQVRRGAEFFRTNCTACHNFTGAGGALPGGRYAPALTGVEERHIYGAMLTGPQQMPVFSDEVLKPEEKRDIIAFLKYVEESPQGSVGGFGMGSLGPVSDGMFAWLVGIGSCVGFAIWIASHSTRSKKGKVEA
ncbi:cytochrome bc1 complex diheme cytochrome c subunit [Nocardioides massiliensis]|uniref:Cytochrome bc1 complex cytochrome c subunit n=1 Tax=Nocardioides massiliensis TaxID=1325935 RepID=A0ABT9NUT3_9ACTN|nr:ubiquinol-cytochrome c reductase cytochrome c subunit [Nocardioides massiliensis]